MVNLLHQFATSNFLTIHVNQPTRITETSATVLDQFLSNIPNSFENIQVLPPLATNDHCTISATQLILNLIKKRITTGIYGITIMQISMVLIMLFEVMTGMYVSKLTMLTNV